MGRITLLVIAIVGIGPPPVTADVLFYDNDFLGFQNAAGPLSIIDFDTLPDGSPSVAGTPITATFNYDAMGAHFTPLHGSLEITGNSTQYSLFAETVQPFITGIDVQLTSPALAVGSFFGGNTELCAYAQDGTQIGCIERFSGGGGYFLGIVSTVPIARVVQSRHFIVESISTFYFSPIPEPCSVMLLGIGVLLSGRKWRSVRITRPV